MAEPAIRAATVEDADTLAAVYRTAYRENRRLGFPAKAESATAETVTGWIREHHVLVATVDGEVVGGVRLSATDPDRVKLSRLAVHEDRKGEGIGSALVDAAEAWVRETGRETVWLTTPDEHPFLPEFYRSRGYEKTGDYPLEYRDYDEIRMEKPV
ncbi:GNAT family N-acetyltransferase [Haloarchaeobius iranensis]|uniref:Putative acetyltransferase n=1 Tax=Haloarchaeobius iranensis TaxID=996166 RepID=A0A1G9UN10_9EURY|nr:GNAT family N-acetyltransferase [Haloarchaeobius iranensis]SDM61289.1 putative acetyltransferase [Haloarchaeobius iranensis]